MRKISLILCAVFLLGMATAVAAESPPDAGASLGSEVVTFDANPTTGYVWTFGVSGDAVTVTDQGLSDPVSDAMGAPSAHSFLVEAAKPGQAVITFTYARAFAPEDNPQLVIMEAQVEEDGNLILDASMDTRALSLAGLGTPTVTATLEANATTGFGWRAVAKSPLIVKDDGYQENEAEEGMVGAGGVETFIITATREGEGTVTFTYVQSWEKDTPPVNTIILSLKVDAEGNITK